MKFEQTRSLKSPLVGALFSLCSITACSPSVQVGDFNSSYRCPGGKPPSEPEAAVKPARAEYRRSKWYSGPFRPIKIYVDDAGLEWRVQFQENVKYGGGTVYGVSKCGRQVRLIEILE